jgi:hypothetical protein
MEGILNNSWVVGIGGGMISGFAVFLLSNVIITRRERKELRQQIRLANSEVIHATRPLIVEKVLPEAGLLNSILSSTAKKYGINRDDLYDVNCLSDDIINEIMNNPFLSSHQKVEYCMFVSRLKGDETVSTQTGGQQLPGGAEKDSFEDKRRRDISLILGAATFSSVLLSVLSSSLGVGTVTFSKETIKSTLWLIAAAITIPTFFLWVLNFYRDVQELKRVQQEVKKVEAELSPAQAAYKRKETTGS